MFIAAAVLGVCALFAAERTGSKNTEEEKSSPTVTETASGSGTKAATTTTADDADAKAQDADQDDQSSGGDSQDDDATEEYTTSPDDGNYIYVKYNGVIVLYYRGCYWIDGAWVWHGRGVAVFPPPRFRPVVRPHHPQPAPPKHGPTRPRPNTAPPGRLRRSGLPAGVRPQDQSGQDPPSSGITPNLRPQNRPRAAAAALRRPGDPVPAPDRERSIPQAAERNRYSPGNRKLKTVPDPVTEAFRSGKTGSRGRNGLCFSGPRRKPATGDRCSGSFSRSPLDKGGWRCYILL